MTDYELQVMEQWIAAETAPLPLSQRLAKGLTGRVGLAMRATTLLRNDRVNQLVQSLRTVAQDAILAAMTRTATAQQLRKVEDVLRSMGSGAESAAEIKMLPLIVKDEVSRQLASRHTRSAAAEGATAGLASSLCELIPGLQGWVIPVILADLTATITMMAQSAVQIGYSYGYNMHDPEDAIHIVTAMSPLQDDAQLLEAKIMAHLAAQESGVVMARLLAGHVTMQAVTVAAPAMARLIEVVSSRIALALAQKELSLLVPIVGAVVQGTVNTAFSRANYSMARRYFQQQHLYARYGEDLVAARLLALRMGTPSAADAV